MTLIFHILSRDAALAARQSGEYRAESLSHEGFIHFSCLHQVLDVANRFYTGQLGLLLLVVETSKLNAELKYEAPHHPTLFTPKDEDFSHDGRLKDDRNSDNTFPHLYGPLNFDAVLAIHNLETNPDGKFSLPASLNTAFLITER